MEALERFLDGSRRRTPRRYDENATLENTVGQDQIVSSHSMSPPVSEDENNANSEAEAGACRL